MLQSAQQAFWKGLRGVLGGTALHHAQDIGSLSFLLFSETRFGVVCRLTAQCAVQPGLGKVYSQILLQSHTSAELYIKVTLPVGGPRGEGQIPQEGMGNRGGGF